MAKLRKGCAYRRIERPYTRKSKYRKKSYVRASPVSKVVRYHMGNLKKAFDVKFELVAKNSLQLRHNCLEAARLTSNRTLEKALSKSGYRLVLRPFPHHVLRENPLAAGAGADRMSTGMKNSFGKPIGIAADIMRLIPCSNYVESGSLSLKICLVADGTADLFIKDVKVRDWDIAAPMLVLEEAGGVISIANGKPFELCGNIEKSGLIVSKSEELQKRALNSILKL